MVYTFELIAAIFVLIMIYLTYLEFKRKRINKTGFIFWILFWFAGIFLVIFHSQVNAILPTLNIIRVMDLYMILAFMFLFVLIFYLFARNSKTEQRLEKLTRVFALKQLKPEMK